MPPQRTVETVLFLFKAEGHRFFTSKVEKFPGVGRKTKLRLKSDQL